MPLLQAPALACDSHVHIYDPAMPVAAAGASPGPAWASVAAYRDLQERLRTERVIVVQPNAYGTNNACTEAAVAELGRARARGVAIVGPEVTEDELARLTAARFCGARIHMLGGGFLSWDEIEPLAAKVTGAGWHLQLQMDGRHLHEREAMLTRLPGNVVIDHVGKFLEPVEVDHPGFVTLLRLLDTGRVYLKLAGPYEVSRTGPPLYRDVGALAKAAIRHAPERIVWASNWPHVSVTDLPDDAGLLNLLLDWAPDEATRRLILVDTPARLYGFDGPVGS